MVNPHLNLRAVICDIYGTLLAVKPPPAGAETRWPAFWKSIPGMKRKMRLDEFFAATKKITAREHAAARAAGVAFPEFVWSRIVEEVVPELAALPANTRDDLLWQLAQFVHRVGLMPGAPDALRKIHGKGLALGLASNSQSYTLRELDDAFTSAGLSRNLFDPALCFFSFEHGFSKPDPAVFHWLAERLQKRNISVNQTLLIGNRLDNDILPARAEGWQTWHFTQQPSGQPAHSGNWEEFCQWLGYPPQSPAQTT